MFILDTDTIIYNLKGNEAIKRNLQDHFEDPMKICVITIMELYYGAYKSKKITGNLTDIESRKRDDSNRIRAGPRRNMLTGKRLAAGKGESCRTSRLFANYLIDYQ